MVSRTIKLRNGMAEMQLRIRFDSAAHVAEFYQRLNDVVRYESIMKEQATSASADMYGRAIINLYELIFGEDATRSIEAWFGDNVLGMVSQINPIISKYIEPDVVKCSAERRRKMVRDFKRTQRRARRHV